MSEFTKMQKLDALGRLVGIISPEEYRRRIAEIHGFDLDEFDAADREA